MIMINIDRYIDAISMFVEPIKSLQQTKEYFRSMGCSHFHMAR